MPHPLPLNPTQGPARAARKLLSNQLYRIVQEKARKDTVGAEIERHCATLSSENCQKKVVATSVHQAQISIRQNR